MNVVELHTRYRAFGFAVLGAVGTFVLGQMGHSTAVSYFAAATILTALVTWIQYLLEARAAGGDRSSRLARLSRWLVMGRHADFSMQRIANNLGHIADLLMMAILASLVVAILWNVYDERTK